MGWLRKKDDKKPQHATNDEDEDSLEQAIRGHTIVVPYVSNNSAGQQDTPPPPPSCCRRFMAELNPCQNWFDIKDAVTGRDIDIPESFAPASCYAFIFKFAGAAVSIFTITYGFIDGNAAFFMAYLTNWGQVFCCLYFVMSVLNTVLASRTPQKVTWRIYLTWILFELTAHSCTVITVLFWSVVYKRGDPLNYLVVAPHGGILALVLIDGLIVNRTPVRWMHWYGIILPVDVLYVVWTVIHSFTGIGNPNEKDSDPETNDDAIYEGVIEWKDDWQTSLFWSAITVFVLGPAVYALLWSVSLGCCCSDRRKYVDSVDETDQRPTVNDVEEGSLFQGSTFNPMWR